jgi:hypothetical protein
VPYALRLVTAEDFEMRRFVTLVLTAVLVQHAAAQTQADCIPLFDQMWTASAAGDFPSAEAIARRAVAACDAVRLPPEVAVMPYSALAKALSEQGKHGAALSVAERSIEVYYPDLAFHKIKWRSLAALGREHEARREIAIARRLATAILEQKPKGSDTDRRKQVTDQQLARAHLAAIELWESTRATPP